MIQRVNQSRLLGHDSPFQKPGSRRFGRQKMIREAVWEKIPIQGACETGRDRGLRTPGNVACSPWAAATRWGGGTPISALSTDPSSGSARHPPAGGYKSPEADIRRCVACGTARHPMRLPRGPHRAAPCLSTPVWFVPRLLPHPTAVLSRGCHGLLDLRRLTVPAVAVQGGRDQWVVEAGPAWHRDRSDPPPAVEWIASPLFPHRYGSGNPAFGPVISSRRPPTPGFPG